MIEAVGTTLLPLNLLAVTVVFAVAAVAVDGGRFEEE
jgi:hypothetical protein